jgi:hypothetical protein
MENFHPFGPEDQYPWPLSYRLKKKNVESAGTALDFRKIVIIFIADLFWTAVRFRSQIIMELGQLRLIFTPQEPGSRFIFPGISASGAGFILQPPLSSSRPAFAAGLFRTERSVAAS